MMLVPTYISPSAINGNGLFAAEPIAKDTLIWEYMVGLDVVIDPSLFPNYPALVRDYLSRRCYPHPTQKGMLMLDGDNGRFINHSETPNTIFDTTRPFSGYALVNIAQGEELTCNYYEYDPRFEFG